MREVRDEDREGRRRGSILTYGPASAGAPQFSQNPLFLTGPNNRTHVCAWPSNSEFARDAISTNLQLASVANVNM